MYRIIIFSTLIQLMCFTNTLAQISNNITLLPDSTNAEKLNNKLKYYILENNSDSIFYYYNKSIDFTKEKNLKPFEAQANYYLGIYYHRNKLSNESTEYLDKAIAIYNETKDTFHLIECLNQKVVCLSASASHTEATKTTQTIMDYYDHYTNESQKNITIINAGINYFRAEDYPKAAESFKKSLSMAIALADTKQIQSTAINLGSAYTMLNKYDSAKFYYKTAYFHTSLNDSTNKAVYFHNIGFINIEEKNYNEALINLQKALNIRQKLNTKKTADTYALIGKLYNRKGDKDIAISYYYRAYKTIIGTNDLNGIKSTSLKLANLYNNIGNYKNASIYYQEHIKYSDSINNINDKATIESLNKKMELNEKAKENKLLESENKLQELQLLSKKQTIYLLTALTSLVGLILIGLLIRIKNNKRHNIILSSKNRRITEQKEELESTISELNKTIKYLEIANATKEKFFSIIAHDLRNPFGAIREASEILNNKSIPIDEETKDLLINELHKSSENTYKLLENLLNWARSQQNAIKLEFSYHDITEIIDVSTEPYIPNAKEKNIAINTKNVSHYNLKIDKNTIQTIIGNIINNAIKFTPHNGKIDIETSFFNDYFSVSITDNGVGMNSTQLNNLFKIEKSQSTPGTNNEAGTGLGLILCHEFIKLNGGQIRAESQVGQGTRFNIDIPNI